MAGGRDGDRRPGPGRAVLVLLTEWNEYRGLALSRLAEAMRGRVIVDLRNVFRLDDMAGTGFRYVSVGRPVMEGSTLRVVEGAVR